MSISKVEAAKVFEALSSPIRLDIFRLLVSYHPEGVVAGQISELLNIKPNNLSFHLKTLQIVDLVECVQEGRFQRYNANIDNMHTVIKYLTMECCANTDRDVCNTLREKNQVLL